MLSSIEAEVLAGGLAEEMAAAWRRGERPCVEDYLQHYPDLLAHPEAAAELICEEVNLRWELEGNADSESVLRRFPQWREQLEVLLACQRLLSEEPLVPTFPELGTIFGDFRLVAELGRGAQGRVYLATQRSLADRPMVLKLTPRDGAEHLSLARLQHTAIVPLYSAFEDPTRNLRVLCMPWFGGTTLATLLRLLPTIAPATSTGRDLLRVLDAAQATLPLPVSTRGPARPLLARGSWTQAVCWIGLCLAEGLQYAHEHGLIHLDIKPSNVLLAADGQPMLLDFHLAQEPFRPERDLPQYIGGTPGYMSPEQEALFEAARQRQPAQQAVDGRSDLYSLGVLLWEALGGTLPARAANIAELRRRNPAVSVGLGDILTRCLAPAASARYPHAAALADDLRSHLADLPLRSVRNRSWRERWQKFRRRHPQTLTLGLMFLTVLGATIGAGATVWQQWTQQVEQARQALLEGRGQISHQQLDEALRSLQRARGLAQGVPLQGELVREIDHQITQAQAAQSEQRRLRAIVELHALADRLRFFYSVEGLPVSQLRSLEAACRPLWEQRTLIQQRLGKRQDQVRQDLLDVAILWASLQVRLASPEQQAAARQRALQLLTEAENLYGPSTVLEVERRLVRGESPGAPSPPPRTAWEHLALGRALLGIGRLPEAAEQFHCAVRQQPEALWPNYYEGLCAYRLGKYEDARQSFSVCIGAAPDAAACFYNRGLALQALGRTERAREDFDQAQRLDPDLPDGRQGKASR